MNYVEIKLELSDWLYNAGIIGLINILDDNDVPYEKKNNYVTFSSEVLNHFEDYYFKYFIHRYGEFTSLKRITSLKLFFKNIQVDEVNEKKFEQLNRQIEYVKKILQSNSYKNTYHLIDEYCYGISELSGELKKVSKKKKETFADIADELEKMRTVILEIIRILELPNVQKYIMARNITYEVIQQYWGGVSFLHKKANKNNMYEEFHKYFIDSIFTFLEEKNDQKKYGKYKYHCFSCENKFSKLESAFELTWINKTGVDSAKKSSHFWNFNTDAYICPICNLVYACVPAGFSAVHGKGIFINQNVNVSELSSLNKLVLYKNEKIQEMDQLEEQSYFKIIDIMEQTKINNQDREIQNIQIVKFDSGNSSRPYTFNILSKDKVAIIQKCKKDLSIIEGCYAKEGNEYIHIYQEVTSRLYNNQNQFDLLYTLFRMLLKNEYHNLVVLKSILNINNNQLGGGRKLYYKEINRFQKFGLDLRKAYAGSENKLSGITYRLLNALKIKNSNRFMDTLINAYMYQKKPIPNEFISALHDEMRFQTIGYAFLLGLQGERMEEKNKAEGEVNNG